MASRQSHPHNGTGLYDPNDERDACGFGMIAQLDDQPSRALVDTAIAALSRMTHRGGVAADRGNAALCQLRRQFVGRLADRHRRPAQHQPLQRCKRTTHVTARKVRV